MTEKSYKNLEFLTSKDARAIRILCEYEEPKSRMRTNGVKDSIVFFGSARAISVESAKEKLKEAEQLQSDDSISKEDRGEILKKAFSTNGLLAYKIENLVKELEELANSYLAELSDGRFTLEFIVSNDKLNVQITDNENIVDILALSSGELARVNTATLIAIRKLMSSISKSRINILFLDEVINVLDESGREKMVEVLLQEDLKMMIVKHYQNLFILLLQ